MMKKAKRFLAMTAALMLCFGLVNLPEINVKAAETLEAEAQEEYPGDVIGTATINLTQTYAIGENGNIKGDGARLRKRPKKTATVLELMYNGELVLCKTRENRNMGLGISQLPDTLVGKKLENHFALI